MKFVTQKYHKLRPAAQLRSEEHTSELQSQSNLVCRLLLEKKKCPHGPRGSRAVRLRRWSSSRRGRRGPTWWPCLPVRIRQLPISFESSHRLPSRSESVRTR